MSHWILKYEHDFKDKLCEYQNTPITIMSNRLYEKFTQKYDMRIHENQEYTFSRIIFDNADTLKIQNCKEINSLFYWFITNKPENLIFPLGKYYDKVLKFNHVKDSYYTDWQEQSCKGIKKSSGFIKNIFYHLSVCDFTIYNTIFLKNDFKYIKDSLNLTISKNYIKCTKDIVDDVLFSFNNILVLLDQKNYLAIAKTLKVNYDGEQNIIKAICKTIDSKIYEEQQKTNIDNNKIKILENKLVEIKQKIINSYKELCCICYEHLKKPIAITKCCNQFFCFKCIAKSVYHQQKMVCPYCRNDFNKTN